MCMAGECTSEDRTSRVVLVVHDMAQHIRTYMACAYIHIIHTTNTETCEYIHCFMCMCSLVLDSG